MPNKITEIKNGRQMLVLADGTFIASGQHPFPNGKPIARHDVYDKHGRWVGDDLTPDEDPHRAVTPGAVEHFGGEAVAELFGRYAHGDYGTGEAGFAAYEIGNLMGDFENVWIIDDAARSPEGEPPARDPNTSPGPLTLLLPSEY